MDFLSYLKKNIKEYIHITKIYVLVGESNNDDDSNCDRVITKETNKWNLCTSSNKQKLEMMAKDLTSHFELPNLTYWQHSKGLLEFAEYVTTHYNVLLSKNYLDYKTFRHDINEERRWNNNEESSEEYCKERFENIKPFMVLKSGPVIKFAGISYSGQLPEKTKFYVEEVSGMN